MKFLLGLLVVCGGIGGVLFYSGSFSFDPVAQEKEARAAINVGMHWDKVVDGAGEPRKWVAWRISKQRIGGQEIEIEEPGPEMKFDAESIRNRISDGTLPAGFALRYSFHEGKGGVFSVKFDEYGDCQGIHDEMTMANLLDQ